MNLQPAESASRPALAPFPRPEPSAPDQPELPFSKPLDNENPHAFSLFRSWLDAGCPSFRIFSDSTDESYSAIRKLAARYHWNDRRRNRDIFAATATDERIRHLKGSCHEKLLSQALRLVEEVEKARHGITDKSVKKLRTASQILKDLEGQTIDPGDRAQERNADFLARLTEPLPSDPPPAP